MQHIQECVIIYLMSVLIKENSMTIGSDEYSLLYLSRKPFKQDRKTSLSSIPSYNLELKKELFRLVNNTKLISKGKPPEIDSYQKQNDSSEATTELPFTRSKSEYKKRALPPLTSNIISFSYPIF